MHDEEERKKERKKKKKKKKKKRNKTDIFTDDFQDFGKCQQKPGSTFYLRVGKDTCV